jgi:chromosome segregation ATPase
MQKILDALRAKGVKVEDFEADIAAAYDEEVSGLKAKNGELIGKLKRARGGEDETPSKMFELEDALSQTKAEAEAMKRNFERELKKSQQAAVELAAKLDVEATERKRMVKDQTLTEALQAGLR